VAVVGLTFERVVDVAEGNGEEDGRVLVVEIVCTEKVVESWVETVAGI
jgi:hypothetical protein